MTEKTDLVKDIKKQLRREFFKSVALKSMGFTFLLYVMLRDWSSLIALPLTVLVVSWFEYAMFLDATHEAIDEMLATHGDDFLIDADALLKRVGANKVYSERMLQTYNDGRFSE